MRNCIQHDKEQTSSVDIAIGDNMQAPTRAIQILLAGQANSLDSSLRNDLERMGCEVHEAGSTIEAIKHLSNDGADILVTTLSFNGWETVLEVSRSIYTDCKVVVATSWGRDLLRLPACHIDADLAVSVTCRFHELKSLLSDMQQAKV